jgi:hypothetical protein
MTLAETCPPTQTAPPSNTWVNATWDDFVVIADDPTSDKKTCYYYDWQMRIETMGVRPDHAVDNTLVALAIGLFCMLKDIRMRGLINASYRQPGSKAAQPDASYYVNEKALLVPQGAKPNQRERVRQFAIFRKKRLSPLDKFAGDRK